MYTSIIIPTYNDWHRLSLCLKALDEQSYDKDKFEILVVNNNPKDTVPDNLHKPLNCIIITEPKAGSYAARNAALRICKGDLIGFTDSDCIPHRDWIKNAVNFLERNREYSRIAGRIELFYKSDKLSDAELYEKVYAFKQDFAASKGASVTGNMFTYRHVIDSVGFFNETLLSGGDYEWSLRAERANFKIAYGEQVIIKHPARSDVNQLVKKAKRTGAYFGKSKISALSRLVKYSIPPFNSFIHGKDLNPSERLKVFYLRYHLNFIRSVEEVKISFGKPSNRE